MCIYSNSDDFQDVLKRAADQGMQKVRKNNQTCSEKQQFHFKYESGGVYSFLSKIVICEKDTCIVFFHVRDSLENKITMPTTLMLDVTVIPSMNCIRGGSTILINC